MNTECNNYASNLQDNDHKSISDELKRLKLSFIDGNIAPKEYDRLLELLNWVEETDRYKWELEQQGISEEEMEAIQNSPENQRPQTEDPPEEKDEPLQEVAKTPPKMRKMVNRRISINFYNTLIQHPVFAFNYKATSGAEYLLLHIAKYNESDGRASDVSSRKIYELFKNYDKTGQYKKYINALIDLGLLSITDTSYCVSKDGVGGWCMKYKVTFKGIELITNNLKEYLNKLHNDPPTRRYIQKDISRREVMKQSYDDYILNYIYDGLINITFDWAEVDRIMNIIPYKAKPSSLSYLTKFKEKKFRNIKYNEEDGRVWNEYVALCKELRSASRYKDMIRKYTLDIRACHPTFMAMYLIQIFKFNINILYKDITIKEYLYGSTYINYLIINNIKTINSGSQILPYCSPKVGQERLDEALFQEFEKYNNLFINTIKDPRLVISEATGYPYDKCKDYLNKTINGHSTYKRIYKYFAANFPILYEIWINSEMGDTGKNISKLYETKLMLNSELFKLAEKLNLKLLYEYDGFSLFFAPQDKEAESKARIIEQFIKGEGKKLFGLDLVLKLDDVSGDAQKASGFIAGTAENQEIALAA